MANLFIDLDTGGAPADVSAQGKTKTFNVAGSFSGWLTIEANCGGEWREVLRFQAPGNDTLDGAFKELRANIGNVTGTVDRITVSADDTGAKFAELPADGTPVDVSALGTFNTVVIGGDPLTGLLKILISDDGSDWTDWKSYQSATVDSAEVVTQFMKVEYDGTGTPEVCIGAINETDSTATPVNNYVYRPGATDEWAAGENVYTDWDELYAALQSTKYLGTRTLEFDGRFSGEVGFANGKICRIPEGTWDMEGVDWTTVNRVTWQNPNFLDAETIVVWDDNAFTEKVARMVGNYQHDGEVHSPLSSAPVLGDEKWVTRLIQSNPNALPMIRIPDNTGFIILFLDSRVQAVTFFSPTAMPAPVVDFGNTFAVIACRGADMRDNFFAGTGFANFLQWPGLNGPHSWDFPAMTGFTSQTVLHGGKFMNTSIDVDTADFTARGNQVRRVDSGAGPITATLFDCSGVVGEAITIMDVSGAAGVNPITVAGVNTIESPYLNKPFQSKTWVSQSGGTWLLQHDSSEDFISSPPFTDDFTCINNATNLVETDTKGAGIAATLPAAASAQKGSKIVIRNTSTAGGGILVTVTPSGGDTVDGALTLGDTTFATYQSDGVSTWYQIA
jgi:hypothetical protein